LDARGDAHPAVGHPATPSTLIPSSLC
jgi:hypothetical protein